MTNTALELYSLRTVQLKEFVPESCARVAVCASGYESRSSHWFRRSQARLDLGPTNTLVLGFGDFANALSRPENDEAYLSAGCRLTPVDSEDREGFEVGVDKLLSSARERVQDGRMEVHVDYSCMPRSWYCRVPSILRRHLRPGDLGCMWYSAGRYPADGYPSAGVEDFHVFSGRASLRAMRRTHFMGIGFDWTRSSAIRSVVDPQRIVCFFADSRGSTKSNYARAMRDNAALLKSAELQVGLPLNDFTVSLGGLVELARQFRRWGDVVLVPDGPKPLILASSLTPLLLGDQEGVVCLHVGRRRQGFEPIDVHARGPVWGFQFGQRTPIE
jgi:hypothetical protein